MVGQLGVNAISAVSIINQILFVFIWMITGTIAGASIFSTQYFGTKDYNCIFYLSIFPIFLLRFGGNTLLLSLINVIFTWLITLPLSYLLIKFSSLDLPTIYLLVSAIIKVFVGFAFIKRKTWLNNLITKN